MWWKGGTHVYVQGEGKNIGDESLADVEAVVAVYTREGRLINTDSSLIDKNPLLPNQASNFLMGADGGGIAEKYRLFFRFLSGDTIPYDKPE